MDEKLKCAETFVKEYARIQRELHLINEQMFDISHRLLILSNASEADAVERRRQRETRRAYRELEYRHSELEGKRSTIEAVVSGLEAMEQTVIRRYYLDGTFRCAAMDLMHELGYEKSQIYRIRAQALAHIYEAMPREKKQQTGS